MKMGKIVYTIGSTKIINLFCCCMYLYKSDNFSFSPFCDEMQSVLISQCCLGKIGKIHETRDMKK